MTNVLLAHYDSKWISETGRNLRNSGYDMMSIYFEFSSSSNAPLGEIANHIKEENIDLLFVDGNFAYKNRLREALLSGSRGLKEKDLPLLVGYLLCEDDLKENLSVSGLDFGKIDVSYELSPVDITGILTQDPIPKTDGLLFNLNRYEERDGLVLPIRSLGS